MGKTEPLQGYMNGFFYTLYNNGVTVAEELLSTLKTRNSASKLHKWIKFRYRHFMCNGVS